MHARRDFERGLKKRETRREKLLHEILIKKSQESEVKLPKISNFALSLFPPSPCSAKKDETNEWIIDQSVCVCVCVWVCVCSVYLTDGY